jgi:hypothetical protein
MTTSYSNTTGNLDKKIILSFPYDPERPDTNDEILVESPGKSMLPLGDAEALGIYSEVAKPNHWQDTISDTIRETSLGGGNLPIDALTHLLDPSVTSISFDEGYFFDAGTDKGGYDLTGDVRPLDDLTIANEFELDCNMITHTYTSLTAIVPLPGIPKRLNSDTRSTAQLNALNIDLGMQREIISCQGILIDRKAHPSSSSEHHIRRQHLLDMVRTQYGYVHAYDIEKDLTWMNVNRFPALTIGPIRRISNGGQTHLDEGYEGEEPSDDVRGTEHTGGGLIGQAGAISSWDPTPSYKGRSRYRGFLTRLNLRNEGGRPDIWQFSFDFIVIKNEMQMRMIKRVGT